MCKRLCFLISFVLVATLASTTYGIVLGDFEDPCDPNHDGWIVYDDPCSPYDPNVTVDYNDVNGVTSGSYSLKIVAEPNSQQALVYDVNANGMLDEFRNNLKISADVTRLVSEWVEVEGAYCDFTLAINAGSSVDPNWDLWYGTPEGGSWLTANGSAPMSITYDYSLALGQIDFDNLEYLELVFSTNWGVFSSGGIYYLDNVQMFGGGSAYAPEPSDGAVQVPRDIILSWTPGAYADKHDVYFGTSFNDVNDANTSTAGIYIDRLDANTYDPPGWLESGTAYYWRIDEVNMADDPNTWKGDVWSFWTPYPGAMIIGDWEQSMDGWEKGSQGTVTFDYSNTIGVTLNNYSLTMNTSGGFWTFQRPGLVNLTDMTLKLDVTMIADEWSGQWTKVDKLAVSSDLDPGYREYDPTAIDRTTGESAPLDWGDWNGDVYKTFSWDLTGPEVISGESYNDWADATSITILIALHTNSTTPGPFHLDYARLVDIRLASNPSPLDYAEEVCIDPTLSWSPGAYAVTHDVYFGTNYDDVDDANRAVHPGLLNYSLNQDPCSYEPDILELDTIYYWRVDEVNDPNIWKGDVWSFMTGRYFVVDDFEDYNDTNTIQDTWIKGGGGNVGYTTSNYAEITIVHGGEQSMPFDYNNTASPYYSEACAVTVGPNSLVDINDDWTFEGVKALSLWFRGYPAYVGSWVESSGTHTITASGEDIWDVPDLRNPSSFHDEFHYAYKEITGTPGDVTIIAKVESVSNTDPWAKAGVMIRQSLDPNSKHGLTCVHFNGTDSFQQRLETGGVTTTDDANSIGLPCWVKMILTGGGYLKAYRSADPGTGWGTPITIGPLLTMPVYVGLAVSAHDPSATCTAEFSNVSITAPGMTISPWSHQDIGIKSNVAALLYVTLQDDGSVGGDTATVTHTDPNIVLQNTWQAWDIALNDFEVNNPSLNLEKIKKITLGVGPADPCGTGTLYFDDIRLYKPRCMPNLKPDLTGDCFIDYDDLQILTNDWLSSPADPNIDLYEDDKIDFKDYAVLASKWLEKLQWPY